MIFIVRRRRLRGWWCRPVDSLPAAAGIGEIDDDDDDDDDENPQGLGQLPGDLYVDAGGPHAVARRCRRPWRTRPRGAARYPRPPSSGRRWSCSVSSLAPAAGVRRHVADGGDREERPGGVRAGGRVLRRAGVPVLPHGGGGVGGARAATAGRRRQDDPSPS